MHHQKVLLGFSSLSSTSKGSWLDLGRRAVKLLVSPLTNGETAAVRVRVNTTSALLAPTASNYCGRQRVATGLQAAGGRLCRLLSRHVDCHPTVDIGLHTVGLVYGALLNR